MSNLKKSLNPLLNRVSDGPNVSNADTFPRAPARKHPDAKNPPKYSCRTLGGYTKNLPKKWKLKVRDRFEERGGKNINLSKASRELLADCVWDMAIEAEISRTKGETVDQLFSLMNLMYDELGINDAPKEV